MHARSVRWLLLFLVAGSAGCMSLGDLPEEPPPLARMEEPLELFDEPQDEPARRALELGGFTGIHATDAEQSLDLMVAGGGGVEVERVVENSPADMAGIRKGDLLLEAGIEGQGEPRVLQWPSEWREVELACGEGATVVIRLDRAGREMRARIRVIDRLRPRPREQTERYREEQRVGVVVRTATQVEARSAGLGPGGGAVIVGLSKDSPWREAGLRYGDLIVEIRGRRVTHPQVVLQAIRNAKRRKQLAIVIQREGEQQRLRAAVTRREREVSEISVPLLFHYENRRGKSELSFLLGLFGYRSTSAAWRLRLLWIISFEGGVADRLEEVGQ